MKHLLTCRRTFIALIGMVLLSTMCLVKGVDTSVSLAAVAMAVAAANAWQKKEGPK
jgi:hypothetical protein